MKIKPQINLPKNYLSKKSSNLIITNDIEIDSENENQNKNENSIIIVNNKKSDEITKPKSKSKDNKNKKKKNKKIKYDKYVLHMIQNKNMKKWKSNLVYCVSNYLSFEENLSIRLVCKLFNEGIKLRYDFLKTNMLFSSDEKLIEKIRIEYNIINKNKKDKILFKELFEDNNGDVFDKKENNEYKIYKDFEFNKREVSNFSKKNILCDMLYNKYYMSIKNKSKKGEFFMPKNFII